MGSCWQVVSLVAAGDPCASWFLLSLPALSPSSDHSAFGDISLSVSHGACCSGADLRVPAGKVVGSAVTSMAQGLSPSFSEVLLSTSGS